MEIGLPSWPALVAEVVAEASRQWAVDSLALQDDLAADRLPQALGRVERGISSAAGEGRSALEGIITRLVADTGRNGNLYKLMAELPVQLFLTTNYDSAFERHLRARGVFPDVFTNTRESLELLDPANYDASIVHVHGSVKHGGQLVITESDYQRVVQAEDFAALRAFLHSHLVGSPLILMGYRLADPDLRTIAQQVAGVIKRKFPVLAILADCDEGDAASFAEHYNVDVLTYDSVGNHRELAGMLRATLKWLKSPQVTSITDADALQLSQALYVQEAVKKAGQPLELAAAKSLLLAVLAQSAEGLDADEALLALKELAGYAGSRQSVLTVIATCVEDGLCVENGPRVRLTGQGTDVVSVSGRKYGRLWDALSDHVQFKVGGEQPLGPVLQSVLVDLFSKRAAEAVSLAVKNQPIDTSSLSLFELVASRAGAIDDAPVRLGFVEYVIDMLRSPSAAQKAVIDHLGRSLFCAHALKLDTDSARLVRNFLRTRVLIVDSNMLISLLAADSPRHESTAELLASCVELGMRLVTTYGFVQEVLIHANWARRFAVEYGNDDTALLAAARGFGVWDGNDFLSGLIQRGNLTGRRQSVEEYIADCLGGVDLPIEDAAARLHDSWGIGFLSSRICAAASDAFYAVRDETDVYISSHARDAKTDSRVHTESEAYAVIHEWAAIGAEMGLVGEAYLLSSGGYLNRVAAEGPRPLDRSVVITPYALAAFLETYSNPDAVHDFAAVVRAEYFNCASDFLEDQELERYFGAVITSADRLYESELRPRLEAMGRELVPFDIPDDLSDVNAVDRPEVVRSLATYLASMTSPEEQMRLRKGIREADARAITAEERARRAEDLLEKRRKGEARYRKAQGRKQH